MIRKKTMVTIVAVFCLVASAFIPARAMELVEKTQVVVKESDAVKLLEGDQLVPPSVDANIYNVMSSGRTSSLKESGESAQREVTGETRDGSLPYEYPTYDSITSYLTETGAQHLYSFGTIPAGVYVQLQLSQPADVNIDYDLYLLKSDYTIIAASESYTYLGSDTNTLQETIGYHTDTTEEYYILVNSAVGGSNTNPYTLEYSLINHGNEDGYEPSERPNTARVLSLTNGQAIAADATLSSAIDNDWYVIDLTNAGGTGTTQLTVSSTSANAPKMEVYTSVLNINQAIAMNKIAQGTSISVPNQLYYIRVLNANAPAAFSVGAIGTYTITASVEQPEPEPEPQQSVTEVTVASMYYDNDAYAAEVNYNGFRGWRIGAPSRQPDVAVYGSAYYTNANGQKVPAAGVQVKVVFTNNSVGESKTKYVTTNEQGAYEARLTTPIGRGANVFVSSYYNHYYDRCRVEASVGDVKGSHNVIHFVKQIRN